MHWQTNLNTNVSGIIHTSVFPASSVMMCEDPDNPVPLGSDVTKRIMILDFISDKAKRKLRT